MSQCASGFQCSLVRHCEPGIQDMPLASMMTRGWEAYLLPDLLGYRSDVNSCFFRAFSHSVGCLLHVQPALWKVHHTGDLACCNKIIKTKAFENEQSIAPWNILNDVAWWTV